jgi:hypothetical protein
MRLPGQDRENPICHSRPQRAHGSKDRAEELGHQIIPGDIDFGRAKVGPRFGDILVRPAHPNIRSNKKLPTLPVKGKAVILPGEYRRGFGGISRRPGENYGTDQECHAPKDYRRLRIPGFRPGKAPLQVIEQRFRRAIADRISCRGAQRVKLMLILKRIAREEGIEVEEAEVDRRIEAKAAEFGIRTETLRADLDKDGGRERL